MEPALIDAIDGAILDMPVGTTRPEAIRVLLRDALIGAGYLENPPDREDAN